MTLLQIRQIADWREARPTGNDHIVDQLIAERTQNLAAHPLWQLLGPLVARALHYGQAVRMSDAIAPLDGHAAFAHISQLLSLKVDASGLENVPRSGHVILMPNHPTGLADGIALFDVLKHLRPDMAFFANRDAVRVAPGFRDMIIPVEWKTGAKTYTKSRDTVAMAAQAFADKRAVVIFPSGRLAFRHEGRLAERPWQPSVVTLARKYVAPIVPVRIEARNSALFYSLSRLSTDIRDMMLFHELLNKKNNRFVMRFGAPISPDRLAGEVTEVVADLQRHTEFAMAADPLAPFEARQAAVAA